MIKLKKTKGFNASTLYRVARLDTLNFVDDFRDGLQLYVVKGNANKILDAYSAIPDCTIAYGRDSSVMSIKGFLKGSHYSVIKQVEQGYAISLKFFSKADTIPVSFEEMLFLENLVRSISVLDK